MKPETIKAIFTNLIFVIGIILTVVGFVRTTSVFAKLVVFGSYPLNSYEETRCQNMYTPTVPVYDYVSGESKPVVNESEKSESIAKCEAEVAQERKLRMVDDVVVSISLLTSGVVLAYSFRRFIFTK